MDTALRLALDLAELPAGEDLKSWRDALFTEVRRRLYPETFPAPSPEVERLSTFFFPLAQAVLEEQMHGDGGGIVQRLPFAPLAEEEVARWPSREEYRRLLGHIEREGLVLCLAMAQEWLKLTILDHVLGVTGLSLYMGRQLARSISVDLPLLHGAAIGHDIGKFGCVGDEVKRIPRLHYYYTHIWYQDRDLPSLGHIATNHSCWDLEQVRLPVETLLLIYADFRVKDWPDENGRSRMQIISLRDAFTAIKDKLENVDQEKVRRYRGVYRKLRDLEEYLQYLGVDLDPPGFATGEPPEPRVPEGLDVLAVLAGRQRPDAVALATGRDINTLRRLLVTAHNLGVMERLRDLPALRALLEEARSFDRWRDLRTYQAILGDYSPALSTEQKSMALSFFLELLENRDDDIRYNAANRIGDLLASKEDFWRKDLPAGVVLRPERMVLDEFEKVLALLDRAGTAPEDDMGPTERVVYAVPIVVRRLLRRADPNLRRQVWELIRRNFRARLGDPRPLVGLYVCETGEIALPHLEGADRRELLAWAEAWAHHEASSTRLMAWRLLLFLARETRDDEVLLAGLREVLESLGARMSGRSTVAELYLLEEISWACELPRLAQRCRELRVEGRDPVREVLLRNLKSRIDWVEKKVNCDYLTATAHLRHVENRDPGSYFANEIAAHFANMLKVSRVEGTRFHAGRCMLKVVPLLTTPQRNDLMVELLRSLELDAEAVTRYIPRFLGSVAASLPEQEFLEGLEDIERNMQRGAEPLQRLLLQTACWVLLSLDVDRLEGQVLRQLTGVLLGALAESRTPTVNEAYAQVAQVLERLTRKPRDDGRLRLLLMLASKKLFSLVTHKPGDRVRFFLAASALNHLEQAYARLSRPVHFPERPSVAFLPGTCDPFTSAHEAIVAKALENADEVLVQMDDYSWRKHALPRAQREELAWMALASVPEAFLAPFRPPINLASQDGLHLLRKSLGKRRLVMLVGSDVVAGASAYATTESAIWDIPHVVVVRNGDQPDGWEERVANFRQGVAVLAAPPRVAAISSTSLRAALDRRADLEALCHPLVARTLQERRLYVNYPAQKQPVALPDDHFGVQEGGGELGSELQPMLDARARVRVVGSGIRGRRVFVLSPGRQADRPFAALGWREVSAAALPVVAGTEELALPRDVRLVGRGALVEELGLLASADPGACGRLVSESLARWLDQGLLFALAPLSGQEDDDLMATLHLVGAAVTGGERSGEGGGAGWAVTQLTDPLVLVWDLETVLQPPFAAAPNVAVALEEGRRGIASFFSTTSPGDALLHLNEEQLKRRVVERAREFLADETGKRWVVLGLGRQFSRDIVGDSPTLAVDLERYLTWQGYEGGMHPLHGGPSLEIQLSVARELGRNALLLVPILDSAEPVLQVVAVAEEVGLHVREVLIGVTEASVRATLELRGIRHRCETVVPRWRGVLRESAVSPYVGGWSIAGREPLGRGSLLPSLNDCLPYHFPHHLGLEGAAALDFSRLALQQTRELLRALEEAFREAEGRLLGVRDLGIVVRTPRCPPFPEGFLPPRERFPSELLAEDIEALARLHPETHAAHRGRWRLL